MAGVRKDQHYTFMILIYAEKRHEEFLKNERLVAPGEKLPCHACLKTKNPDLLHLLNQSISSLNICKKPAKPKKSKFIGLIFSLLLCLSWSLSFFPLVFPILKLDI